MKFAGEMGTGLGLGDSGKDCEFGTFYLDVLRVFLSRLRLYAIPLLILIGQITVTPRPCTSGSLAGAPSQQRRVTYTPADWLEKAVRTS